MVTGQRLKALAFILFKLGPDSSQPFKGYLYYLSSLKGSSYSFQINKFCHILIVKIILFTFLLTY